MPYQKSCAGAEMLESHADVSPELRDLQVCHRQWVPGRAARRGFATPASRRSGFVRRMSMAQLENQLAEAFVCAKCDHHGARVDRLAMSGTGLSRLLEVQALSLIHI